MTQHPPANKAMDVAKPYECIGFGAMDVTNASSSLSVQWTRCHSPTEHKHTNRYSMLHNASGPEIGLPGRILAGLQPGKHRNRTSGRPKAGRRADFGSFPVAVRPMDGPETRLRNIEYSDIAGQVETRSAIAVRWTTRRHSNLEANT
jgi:hypothetical protein